MPSLLWSGESSELDIALRDFYEATALLYALDPIRDSSSAHHIPTPDPSSPTYRRDILREFLNAVSLICDTQKGGTTCTAAALHNNEGQNVLLLASNQRLLPQTIRAIEEIVKALANLHNQEKRIEQVFSQQVLRLLGNLSTTARNPRMKHYVQFLYTLVHNPPKNNTFASELPSELGATFRGMLNYLERMFKQLEQQKNPHGVVLTIKKPKPPLRPHSDNIPVSGSPEPEESRDIYITSSGLERIFNQCQRTTKTKELAKISEYLDQNNKPADHFRNLRHNIGRLARYAQVAKALIDVARARPELFPNMRVDPLETSTSLSGSLASSTTTEVVLGRIFEDPTLISPAIHGKRQNYIDDMKQLYNPIDGHSSDAPSYVEGKFGQARDKINDPNLQVHAEIVILNHFNTHSLEFADREDPFIGCSKPTCYLCLQYLSTAELMSTYNIRDSRSSSHNKLWLNWRLPNNSGREDQVQADAYTLRKMTEKIRQVILRHIREGRDRYTRRHMDSTSGVTFPSYNTNLSTLSRRSSMENLVGDDDYQESHIEEGKHSEVRGPPNVASVGDEVYNEPSSSRVMPGGYPMDDDNV